ncbi:MAG: hypothetical protein ABI068_08635 [Ktedonobacterales bacterium]
MVDDHDSVYFSADAGDSWRLIPAPPDSAANSVAFETIAAGRIYMGAY